jgi:hypothetical protein
MGFGTNAHPLGDAPTKPCTTCGRFLGISRFHKLKAGLFGVGSICKDCRRRYDQARYGQKREQILAYSKQWHKDHPEANKAAQARWKAKHKHV